MDNENGWYDNNGWLQHCGTNAIWKDCSTHEECYYAVCEVCLDQTLKDCEECLIP